MTDTERCGVYRTTPRAPNILLSIEPEWADAILDGTKRYEYRKVAPAQGPPMRLVLYASAPVKAAVGVAWSYNMARDCPVETIVEETARWPSTPQRIRQYFDGAETGNAIHIASYRRFDEPIPRSDLVDMGLTPSQNFRYIDQCPAHEIVVEPKLVRTEKPEVETP